MASKHQSPPQTAVKPSAITFVLVRPRNPGNLGAVARVMKNLGLSRLALVDPRTDLDGEALEWACGADDVLRRARVYPDLAAAIARARYVVATTGRRRTLTPPFIDVAELAPRARERGATALVFGPERTGLTAEELALCHAAIALPTRRGFASLNLAQAVAIVAWELRQAQLEKKLIKASGKSAPSPRAAHGQVEAMFTQAEEALLAADFLKPGKTLGPLITLRGILDRAALTPQDVRFLRGVFRQINNLAKRAARKKTK